ncbi:hypothetical protein MY522_22390, partial [Thalassospira xiamenensis]
MQKMNADLQTKPYFLGKPGLCLSLFPVTVFPACLKIGTVIQSFERRNQDSDHGIPGNRSGAG